MFKKIILLILGFILIILSFIEFKKKIDKTEHIGYIKFLSGNKLVQENKLKEAIEEYKVALDNNSDINIKKNYELALKKEKNEQKQQDMNQNNNQNNDEKNKESKKNEQNNNSKQDNQENNESKSEQKSENDGKEQQKIDELRSIMKRLEGNEKKAFKNNEQILNMSENKNSENRW